MFFFKKRVKKAPIKDEVIIPFDSSNLDQLIDFIQNYCGINLIPKKDVLKERFIRFCKLKSLHSFSELLENIKYNPTLRQEFTDLITVNETYFMREIVQLKDCINYIKKSQKDMRILSAPCSSGEEVYSLAILAHEANIPSSSLKIVGVDISSNAIQKAKEKSFSERSLHRLTPAQKELYFKEQNSRFELKDFYFCPIEFYIYNIFDNSFLQLLPFDVIFSRNMMIYFDEAYKQRAVERFYHLLKPSGRLYTGHADLMPKSSLFKKVTIGKLSYYEKI